MHDAESHRTPPSVWRAHSTAPQFWMNLQVQQDFKEFEASEKVAQISRDVQPGKGPTA